MLFNSFEFLLFFPAVCLLYFALPPRWRVYMLLAASYYFYMCWKVEYILLIVFSTLIDYAAAIKMSKEVETRRRRPWLWLSLASNLGLLMTFKYANFFAGNVQAAFDSFNILAEVPAFDLLLPVGISFYTFQTLAYTIDVYRGRLQPEKDLARFALYVSFFPQLVAGPIERATHLLPQFREIYSFNVERITGGIQQMLWGFFKKVVIADRFAVFVNATYAQPEEASGLTLLMATYFFAFQIYCDFSGYSDIAIGAARIMGYDLMDNFRTPYLSSSIREFWSRWHISLSTWFRDYLYIPLGGNRVQTWRWYTNLMVVFVVSGFWHGANWTFIVWGALHGGYLIAGELLTRERFGQGKTEPHRLKKWFQMLVTFHLVVLAWVFFRAENVGQAMLVLEKILSIPVHLSPAAFMNPFQYMEAGVLMINLLLLVGFLFADPWLDRQVKQLQFGHSFPAGRWVLAAVLSLIIILGHFGDVEFIYFQF